MFMYISTVYVSTDVCMYYIYGCNLVFIEVHVNLMLASSNPWPGGNKNRCT